MVPRASACRRLLSLVFIVIIFLVRRTSSKEINFPVILVPGDGGTQMEAKIDETFVPHYICYKQTKEFFPLWLNLEELLPYVIQCFVHNMKLVYDVSTRTTRNMPGVQTRIRGWGNTSTIDYLDANHWSTTKYFVSIIQALEKIGYKKGKSIRGVPYDFRKAPNEFQELYKRIQTLIEETYKINSNKKCVVIGHSMGNPVMLYFFNHMSQEWKDKYIQSFVSLAGPWAGAVKPVRLMASGDNLGVGFVRALSVRPEQRAMPSTAWLLPSPEFWSPDDVLVVSPTRNYTAHDYKDFFADVKFETGYEMLLDTQHLISPLKGPGVPLHCLHGINMSTPGQLVYDKSTWFDSQPKVISDNGDGTVNERSLRACLKFKSDKTKVYHKEFDKTEHMKILQSQAVIDYIVNLLTNKPL